MAEQIELNANWGDRKETLDQCAERAARCLQKLIQSDALLSQWFQLGNSREEALEKKFDPTFESCRNLLAKGRNRRDTGDRAVFEDLGYHMWLWNGGENMSSVGLRFYAGAHPNNPEMLTPNECVITFPTGGTVAESLLKPNKLSSMIEAVVCGWDPDWVRVSTFEMSNAVYGEELRKYLRVGWLTYLSDRYGPLPTLPERYETMRIEGLGNLIIVKGVDSITASNPEHVEALGQLSSILRTAGILTPTPPKQNTSPSS